MLRTGALSLSIPGTGTEGICWEQELSLSLSIPGTGTEGICWEQELSLSLYSRYRYWGNPGTGTEGICWEKRYSFSILEANKGNLLRKQRSLFYVQVESVGELTLTVQIKYCLLRKGTLHSTDKEAGGVCKETMHVLCTNTSGICSGKELSLFLVQILKESVGNRKFLTVLGTHI